MSLVRLSPFIYTRISFRFSAPDDRFPGVILTVLFGYTQRLYLVQAIGYGVFLMTVGGIYFQSLSGRVIFPIQESRRSIAKKLRSRSR